ncbi:MAG: EAL domain-containing protein [Gammaproteobacteria bacterium]|nr:MAG: EAL domain-containing protein [Gammaproteobacteria bacterium]
MAGKSRLTRLLNSYSGRMIGGVLLLHVFLLPFLLTKVINLIEHSYISQFVNNSRSDAYLLSDLVGSTSDQERVRSYLNEAVLTSRVEFASYKGRVGESISLGRLPERLVEDFSFASHGDKVYQIIVPVFDPQAREVAELALGYDERPVELDMSQSRRSVYTMMAVYFTAMLMFAIFFARSLARPINQLQTLTRYIAEGGYGKLDETVGIKSSITEIRDLSLDLERTRRQLLEQTSKLEFQAYHDSLTRLPNRLLLEDRVEQMIRVADRHGKSFSLLILDLDKFKEVNDTLGHHVGDQLLGVFANRVRRSLRNMDTFARLSGDEFAILLSENDRKKTEKVIEKISVLLERPFTVDDQNLQVSASIGVAIFPEHANSYSGLLKCADIAMYHAKRQGKLYSMYSEEMEHLDVEKIGMANELRNALKHGDLVLYYQPKLSLNGNRVDCVEALVRWKHPRKGILVPDEFIPVAEKSQLINELTYYVLDQALRQCHQWQQKGLFLTIAVNLSARNLLDESLLRNIRILLDQYQVLPDYLELEVTESMVMRDPALAQKVLREIIKMGINVVMDDFGSGYTSLTQLVSLPVSVVKIDKSFVLNMFKSREHRAIVKSVIDLSHSLGKLVVSEGVENQKIMAEISEMKSDQVQGFHICSPLPADQLEDWLNKTDYRIGEMPIEKYREQGQYSV